MALTLEEANRIAQGAVAKAKELNIRVSVAVCDAGGRLMAFHRPHSAVRAASWPTGQLSQPPPASPPRRVVT
jgi:uncharacterized protein GlcG (DUF336 family)